MGHAGKGGVRLLVVAGLVVVGVGLFLALGPPGLLAKSETPDFCASCHVMESQYGKRSIRRVLSGRAGSRISSGRYDEALRIAVLGQEGLALGVSGCRRQVLEEVAQVAVWLQPVGLGRFDEGVDGGRGVGSARMA